MMSRLCRLVRVRAYSTIPFNSSLTDYRMRIMAAANARRAAECFRIASGMKTAGVAPDLTTYNTLLSTTTNEPHLAWAIFDDMLRSGIKPSADTFARLILAQRNWPSNYVWNATKAMSEHNIKPTPVIYSALISVHTSLGNLDNALQEYFTMQTQDLFPDLAALQELVVACADSNLPRLAIDIATYYEKHAQRNLDSSTWLACLCSSARSLYADGVSHSWPIVVDKLGMIPSEGLCMSVLNTAARNGMPDLATDGLRVLKLAGVQWKEYHFAALIEAFCRKQQLKEAFITLEIMRANEIMPVRGTLAFIRENQLVDPVSIDAAWEILDEIHKESNNVGIDALNTIIDSANAIGDLQRMVGGYKAFPGYGVKPNLATFNLLLDGCIAAQHRALGDLVLSDMKKSEIQPDEGIFRKTILLCLGQEVYEDAFYYLEEMKVAGFKPPYDVYLALIHKCWSANDPRVKIVLEEMKECDYPLPEKQRALGTSLDPSTTSSAPSTKPFLDRSTLEFINTGGAEPRHK